MLKNIRITQKGGVPKKRYSSIYIKEYKSFRRVGGTTPPTLLEHLTIIINMQTVHSRMPVVIV